MASVVELEVESSLPFSKSEAKLIEENVNSDLSSNMKPDDDKAHPSESDLKDGIHQKQVQDLDGDDVLNEEGGSPIKIVDENVEDKSLSADQVKDGEPNVGNQQVTVQTNHLEKEAELESYLDSLKPKPKKLSLKERLMLMPGYKDLAALKPKLGGGDVKKNDIIILDEETNKRMKAKDQKRQKQIELLKERFVRHCIAPPPKSVKGEHVKLKINKKEEDSQGIEHLVENEVDYVRNPLNEEEDAVGFGSTPQSVSPKTAAPGVNFRRIQETLLNQIHAKKLKEHEQRVKDYAMYNDENYEDDKEEPEEIIEDEDELSSDDAEEEEEEELEDLLNGAEKKKRKKSLFVDDEAEDEDDNDGDDDDDDDDDDDSSEDDADDSDSIQNEKKAGAEEKDLGNTVDLANAEDSQDSHHSVRIPSDDSDMTIIKRRVINKITLDDDEDEKEMATQDKDLPNGDGDDLESIGATEDSLPSVHSFSEKQVEAITTPIKSPDNVIDFGADFTPKVSTVVLNQITPSDIWIPSKSNLTLRQVDDLIPRIDKPENQTGKHINPDVPESLANVISEPKARFDDLVDMCSGRFVTQTQVTKNSAPSQDEGEFSGFDFGDDDDGDCKVSKSNEVEDDEEEVITRIKKIPKQRRLQFSDDEDEGNENEEPEADDEEEEVEDVSPEISPVKLAANNPFFNKNGLLKRKFVEDEAELSGSEEGSDDEDEKGLNHYEMEEADEEEIDVDAVRNEVERHHLKRLLDDDDRDIRHLQNRYLENGDLHTDRQREKKFKWGLNANDLNDDAQFGDSDDEEQAEENPDETSQKQAWIEKRKWMSENSHLLESGEDESQSLFNSSRFLRISKSTVKKIESFSVTSESEPIKLPSIQRRSIYEEIISNKSMMNDSESVSQPLDGEVSWTKSTTALKKGSFLSRGGLMLAKMAETSKAGDVVSNVKNNSRNFVFQHITPPNTEKTDGTTSRVKRIVPKAVTKKVKVDRSFHNLDEASKGSSIFKWL